MPNSKQIVYLSQAQYAELITNGTITVNGVTVTYDENDIYVTPQAEPVTDVRVDGTSISNNGIANIPKATTSVFGAASILNEGGLALNSEGRFYISTSSEAQIKAGTGTYKPLTAPRQHIATFYGLAKAAGHDEKDSTEPLGTYTPSAKAAIQQMLGISNLLAPSETTTASKAYSIGEVFTSNGKLYKATAAIAAADSIVVQDEGEEISGHNAEETKVADYAVHDIQVNGASVVTNGVANVPVATNVAAGVARFISGYGIYMNSEDARIVSAYGSEVKAGTHQYRPITPSNQDAATFYGLAKAAGDATQSASDNAVGTYTDEAKAAIKSMIGVNVEDVQVNGTSVITDGVANIPIAKRYNNDGGALGVVSIGQGLVLTAAGMLFTDYATTTTIKKGTTYYQPITPVNQHAAAFYGLAKASGDTTQSASSNAVGTYTDSAKASIKSMLGIVDGSTGTVSVSGTTPTITAVENTRYVCGEVSTLSFTPPASGISIVRFTSGTTATVLTLPSTVKFPEWFDATALEADTIYELCVTDGIYGAVMSWAL